MKTFLGNFSNNFLFCGYFYAKFNQFLTILYILSLAMLNYSEYNIIIIILLLYLIILYYTYNILLTPKETNGKGLFNHNPKTKGMISDHIRIDLNPNPIHILDQFNNPNNKPPHPPLPIAIPTHTANKKAPKFKPHPKPPNPEPPHHISSSSSYPLTSSTVNSCAEKVEYRKIGHIHYPTLTPHPFVGEKWARSVKDGRSEATTVYYHSTITNPRMSLSGRCIRSSPSLIRTPFALPFSHLRSLDKGSLIHLPHIS